MTKFKVGDKVRLVGEEWATYEGYGSFEFDPEAVYTVDKVDNGGNVYAGSAGVIERGSVGTPYLGYEVELVEEADPTSPDHYKFGSGAEVIDITRHLDFLTGNAIKYLARSGRKGDRLTDLKKALRYVQWAIEDEENA